VPTATGPSRPATRISVFGLLCAHKPLNSETLRGPGAKASGRIRA
jgi:hypothetical protein